MALRHRLVQPLATTIVITTCTELEEGSSICFVQMTLRLHEKDDFDLVIHGSHEHIEVLHHNHTHYEERHRQLKEENPDLVAEFERALHQLDALLSKLHMISEHAVQLDANFSKYGYSVHLRTRYSGDEDEASIGDSTLDKETWHAGRKLGETMRFYQKPVVRRYFHKVLLWRAREAQEVASYELLVDLFYVGIIAVTGDTAAEHLDGQSLLRFVITFIMGWKFWTDISLLISWFDSDDVLRRCSVLFILTCLLGFTTNMVDAFEHTCTPLVAFYVTSRLYLIVSLFWYSYLIPMVRASMIGDGVIALVPVALWIGSTHVKEPSGQGLIWTTVLFNLFGSFLLIMARMPGVERKLHASWKERLEFYPGVNVEHRIERTNAFMTLVFGSCVLGILYQSSSAIGMNEFFGKAVLGLIQAFVFNWIYFEIDSFNLHTHAIRRRVWAEVETLYETFIGRPEDHISESLVGYYCSGPGVSLICLALIAWSQTNRKIPNQRVKKNFRILFRIVIAIVMICLSLAHLDSLELVATTTALNACVLVLELGGRTCWGESFWWNTNCGRNKCIYSTKCGNEKEEIEKSLKDGTALNVEEIAKRDAGEKAPSTGDWTQQRTGHPGNWSRSKYQPKGYRLMDAGPVLPIASSELSPVAEHAVSVEHSKELFMSNESLLNAEPFNSDDSNLSSSIHDKEADAINEADIQAHLLTQKSHDSSDDDNEEVEADHTQVTLKDSTAAPFPEARATPIIKGISLTNTIADADSSNASSRIDNDDSDSASNTLKRLSKSFPKIRRLIHTHYNKGRITKSDPVQTGGSDRAQNLNTSTHVVKDSEYYSNVNPVFRFDDRVAKSSNWTGTVPLYSNSGSILLLEDVLDDAGAHTNVVSLPKLHEAGMFTDFNGAGATVYNAVDNRPVSRAMIQDNVYCLEDLASPPSATMYLSRPTVQAAPLASTPQAHSPKESISAGSLPGVVDFISSAWALHSNLFHFPTSMSKTTTYPPFESAPRSTSTASKGMKQSNARDTISSPTSQPPSTTPSITLPFDVAPAGLSLKPNSSPLPVTAPKRKSSDELDGLDENPAKHNRFGAAVHDRIGHHLLGLREKAANITKGPLSWSLPRAPGMPQLPDSFGWGPYRILNSTSTPSSFTDSLSLITSVEEMPVETADSFEEKVVSSPSQWSLPSKLPGLGIRVDARDYILKKPAAEENDESESRLDLEKMIQEVEDHTCPPCDKCEECWLF
ncbi:hypothetical protein E8E11_000079 [Didymella keratinophila]|nr:hypothetical protein E8E11_000079 [Didymella keratinophila]